jgi:hypothetical protein
MSWAGHVAHRMRKAYKIVVEILKIRDHSDDLDADGGILEWILEKEWEVVDSVQWSLMLMRLSSTIEFCISMERKDLMQHKDPMALCCSYD